jgi:hypothetical protein
MAAPFYRYDPTFGDQQASYTPVDFRSTHRHRPEVQARFVAQVEGETLIRTLGGQQAVTWRAEPGTPCLILGYWSDGTVHVSWPGLSGSYRIDARFPPWVVAAEDDPTSVRDPHTLPASTPPRTPPPPLAPGLVLGVLILLVVVGAIALAAGVHFGPL